MGLARSGAPARLHREAHGVEFERLNTPDEALAALKEHAKGCVVWDKEVRTSLIVAFTVCGLERALVVNEDQIPLAEKHGLKQLEDLRGIFRGKPDHEIYQIAFDRYWDQCSRDYVFWLGGVHGEAMEPGVADFGIMNRGFFCDLSANPNDPEELALHKRILRDMKATAIVMGWHSYAKDTEGQHVTLVSNHGLRMEGLNTLPNISFTSQIPMTSDFEFKNNHNVEPDEKPQAEKKVYLSLVQTDSMGIGAWVLPGRGKLPYAWQVLMRWSEINPIALQYFYEQRTPNDYFIGGLSGPGYMYPKAIPADKFPGLMAEAREMMKRLDLRIFEIMDYSQGNRHIGNTDLPKELVDRYYEAFPDVIGFINGYGAARTFDLRDGRPFISYDYYLDPERPEAAAAADLEELIWLNQDRPYFLLVHVRESSSIERVSNILRQVVSPVEIVPLDTFLKLAASAKTYRTRYQKPDDPIDLNP
ncbi:MAG: GxGYxYP domain-containing protein [Opitutaceae bacterium]